MTKVGNKMMVAAAVNRRRMERNGGHVENRRVPMYTDGNGNPRRINGSYGYGGDNGVQNYYPNTMGDMPYYGGSEYPAEMRQRRGANGRYMTGSPDYDMRMDDDRMMRVNMPMIGFDRGYERGMDRTNMSQRNGCYNGNIYARGSIMMSPNGMDDMDKPIDEMTAMKWVKGMKPEDGSDGMKFKFEQSEQIRRQVCPDCDPWEYFVALNMMHADYCTVAKKLGFDTNEFYAHMAKAFLCDKDAGEHKLRKYMTMIPQ